MGRFSPVRVSRSTGGCSRMFPAAGRAARRAPVRVGRTGRPWSEAVAGCTSGPDWTSRPVGGVYGRSGLRPGTEPGGASAEARVKGAFGPRLKPGRPPTVFMSRRIKAGYLVAFARE